MAEAPETDTAKTTECGICGGALSEAFCETLKCSHVFHYECILKTYQMSKKGACAYKNRCPYCRANVGYLSIVNGCKPIPKIHHPTMVTPQVTQIRCQHLLLCGKRKGQPCDKKSSVGTTFCKTHQPTT
jgi:hypothetical protein